MTLKPSQTEHQLEQWDHQREHQLDHQLDHQPDYSQRQDMRSQKRKMCDARNPLDASREDCKEDCKEECRKESRDITTLLSNDVLSNILAFLCISSHLHILPFVSQRFRKLLSRPSSWPSHLHVPHASVQPRQLFSQLAHLKFHSVGASQIGDAELEILAKWPLQRLGIKHSSVSSLQPLARLTSLTSLVLFDVEVKDKSAGFLADLPLVDLLSETNFDESSFFSAISTVTTLTILTLEKEHPAASMIHLRDLPLRQLRLIGVTNEHFIHLQRLPLEHLGARGPNLTDEGFKYFASWPLRSLHLYCENVTGKGFAYLPRSLEQLELYWSPLSEDPLSLLSETKLRKLHINLHHSWGSGLKWLPRTIEDLRLSEMSADGAAYLRGMKLHMLMLDSLNDAVVIALAESELPLHSLFAVKSSITARGLPHLQKLKISKLTLQCQPELEAVLMTKA